MTSSASGSKSTKGWHIALLIVQILLGLTLAGTGIWKLVTPIPVLASKFPWMGEVSPSFLYLTALCDSLCGVGIFLPTVTRIKPHLAVSAAAGTVGLMLGAIAFHISRGEGSNTPFNFVMIALALFVAWGRRFKAPVVAPRA